MKATERIIVDGALYRIERVGDCATIVETETATTKAIYAGILKDFRTQMAKVVRWDGVTSRMVEFKQTDPVMYYDVSRRVIESIIKDIRNHGSN